MLARRTPFSSSSSLRLCLRFSTRSGPPLPPPLDPPRRTLQLSPAAGGSAVPLVYTCERSLGASFVVVALHGSPGSTYDWRYLSQPLSAACPQAALLRLEVPGFGGSAQALVASPAGADVAAAIVGVALPAAAAAEGVALRDGGVRPVLLGHSIGCELALLSAAQMLRGGAPPAAVVLVNPIGLRPHRALRPIAAVRLAASLLDLPAPLGAAWRTALRSLWIKVFRFPPRVTEADVAWGQRRAAALDFEGLRAAAAALSAARVPCAVLYSTNDHLVEPAVSRELADALAARVVVDDAAGHCQRRLTTTQKLGDPLSRRRGPSPRALSLRSPAAGLNKWGGPQIAEMVKELLSRAASGDSAAPAKAVGKEEEGAT